MPVKGTSQGSVYYNKQRDKWSAQYYDIDIENDTSKKKSKLFSTKEEAEKYLQTIMYQKENPLYIKNNGIPMN